jgi:hypothetical protein
MLGILRLRRSFASRSSGSAQDDKGCEAKREAKVDLVWLSKVHRILGTWLA